MSPARGSRGGQRNGDSRRTSRTNVSPPSRSKRRPLRNPPAQGAPAAAPSMPDQLKQLAALHEQGALTDDEFTTAKARLLGT